MTRQWLSPKTIPEVLRLTRFWNLAIIGLGQYFTAVFLLAISVKDFSLLMLSVSTVAIAAGGYVINDYYDVKIDLINKPQRVVIGRTIPRRYALLFHSLLSLTGVAIGFLLNWRIGVINLCSSFLLWWYSNNLKRQPLVGNLSVSVLTGLSIAIVGVLFQITTVLVIYSIFALSMTLVREVIKDMEDLKGDNTFGCKTLPIVWGVRKTKTFVHILVVAFVASVVAIRFTYLHFPLYYLLFLLVPMVYLTVRLARADTVRDFYMLSQFCKAIMLLGILSMAFVQ